MTDINWDLLRKRDDKARWEPLINRTRTPKEAAEIKRRVWLHEGWWTNETIADTLGIPVEEVELYIKEKRGYEQEEHRRYAGSVSAKNEGKSKPTFFDRVVLFVFTSVIYALACIFLTFTGLGIVVPVLLLLPFFQFVCQRNKD